MGRGAPDPGEVPRSLAAGGARVIRPGQYTRSSATGAARDGKSGSLRSASRKRPSAACSAVVRTGLNGVASSAREAPDATTCRSPWWSRRATAQPSSVPMLSRARPARRSGFSLAANNFETRRPRSSSSQYATVSGNDGGTGSVTSAIEVTLGRSRFFVRMSFALRGAPCGDDAHSTVNTDRGNDREQPAGRRESDRYRPLLRRRVRAVRPVPGERMDQHSVGLLEAHPMLCQILARLFRIPRRPIHPRDHSHRPFAQTYRDNRQVSRG